MQGDPPGVALFNSEVSMARDIESLTLRMSADLRRFEKSMASMSAIADKRLTAVEAQALRSQRNLARTMERAGVEMVAGLSRGLAQLAPVLAGAFSVAQVTQYADAWASGRNSLAAAGVATADLAGRQEELLRIANESRTSTEATVGLYTRLTIATQELGLSSADTLRLTELLNKSFAASGGSAQEAASAALQLSQALASGTLQGDELRSLRENAPLIAQAIADSMGVGIGALKKLGAEGKITAEVVTRALFAASADIESRFQSTQMTVGQALTVLDNQLGAFVGRTAEGLSATQRLANGIVALANHLDDAADVVIVAATAIGTALASRAVGSAVVSFSALRAQVALTNAQMVAFELQSGLAAGGLGRLSVAGVAAAGSMRGLSAAMAFFGGPIGLLITGLAAGIALLAVNAGQAEQEASSLADEIERQARAAGTAAAETARLGGEISATETWAAGLTGQTHLLADAHFRAAAAAKAQAIETARLRLQEAGKTLDTAQDALNGRRRVDAGMAAAGPLVDSYGRPRPGNGLTGDQRTAASQEFRNLRGATATVQALTDNLNRLLDAPLDDFVPAAHSGGGGGGGRVRGSTSDARARAAAAREEAEATAKRRAEEELINALVAAGERRTAARVAGQEREAALLRDQLETTAELARLAGDPAAAEAAERELWINERINELLALRPELSAAARRAQATSETEDRAAAGRQGEDRQRREDQGRDMARSIVDVLRSDNIWEEAGRRFKDAAWDGVEDFLVQLFKNMNIGGGEGGGGWLGQAVNAVLGSFGKRASGGPVMAGSPYIVGEKQPEIFVPRTSGTIIPSVNGAMAMAQRTARSGPGAMSVSISLAGANGDAAIERISRQAAMEGTMAAIAQSRLDTLADRRASRYRRTA